MRTANQAESPTRWMTLQRWLDCTGFSRDAFNGKRRQGVLLEREHWIKAPDGRLLVDWRAIEQWMESTYDQTNDEPGGGGSGHQENDGG